MGAEGWVGDEPELVASGKRRETISISVALRSRRSSGSLELLRMGKKVPVSPAVVMLDEAGPREGTPAPRASAPEG